MRIEKMKPSDWHQVARIYKQGIDSGNSTYVTSLPAWKQWNNSHMKENRFVAKEDNKIIGFIVLSQDKNITKDSVLISIYVSNEKKRQGVGTQLLNKLISEVRYKKLNSLIFPDNTASINLHRKLGFVCTKKIKNMFVVNGKSRDVYLYEWQGYNNEEQII